MKREMVWIDAHGKLYRGFGREYPAIVWHANEGRWIVTDIPTPVDWDWGALVTKREAERCYPGSTSAPPPNGIEIEAEIDLIKYRPELFDEYDGPIYRKSPAEEAEDRRDGDRDFSPPYMRERGAEVQIAKWFGRWKSTTMGALAVFATGVLAIAEAVHVVSAVTEWP